MRILVSLLGVLNAPSPVAAQPAIWAKHAVVLTPDCSVLGPSISQRIDSPDHKSIVRVSCRRQSAYDEVRILRVVTVGAIAQEVPLGLTDNWRPKELLWSPDSKAFAINGSENAYAGNAFIVYDLRSGKAHKLELVRRAQRDMARQFPPCKGHFHDPATCRRIETQFNMSAIAWARGSDGIIVMGEVPCSSSYGGIMCQVAGYEIDSRTGQILQRMSAKELKARWQSEMAFSMHVPERPVY